MTSPKDQALSFEGVKVSMSQDKNGIILRLSVHPNDCPQALHTDWVGTRYMVAMVRLADDDTPEIRPEVEEANKLVASAGLLCRNVKFAEFLVWNNLMEGPLDTRDFEEHAADALRAHCNISSRSDFRTNKDAREAFIDLRKEFQTWMRM